MAPAENPARRERQSYSEFTRRCWTQQDCLMSRPRNWQSAKASPGSVLPGVEGRRRPHLHWQRAGGHQRGWTRLISQRTQAWRAAAPRASRLSCCTPGPGRRCQAALQAAWPHRRSPQPGPGAVEEASPSPRRCSSRGPRTLHAAAAQALRHSPKHGIPSESTRAPMSITQTQQMGIAAARIVVRSFVRLLSPVHKWH